jgi:hypothetical protein
VTKGGHPIGPILSLKINEFVKTAPSTHKLLNDLYFIREIGNLSAVLCAVIKRL